MGNIQALLFLLFVHTFAAPVVDNGTAHKIRISLTSVPDSEDGFLHNILPTDATIARRESDKWRLTEHPGHGYDLSNVERRETPVPLRASLDTKRVYGEILLGGGGVRQKFNTLFDTGSNELSVPGILCTESQGCVGPDKYNNKGKNLGVERVTRYVGAGDGQIGLEGVGDAYQETLLVGHEFALETDMISLRKVSPQWLTYAGNTVAVAGLAPTACTDAPLNFFEQMCEQDDDLKEEFSFYHGRQGNAELHLGFRDPALYQSGFVQIPLFDVCDWALYLTGLKVGVGPNSEIPLQGPTAKSGKALIDTGVAGIDLPASVAEQVFARVPQSFPILVQSTGANTSPMTTGLWAYPCGKEPVFQVRFQQRWFPIQAADFRFIQPSRSLLETFKKTAPPATQQLLDQALQSPIGFCLSTIRGIGSPTSEVGERPRMSDYSLGVTFLRNVSIERTVYSDSPSLD